MWFFEFYDDSKSEAHSSYLITTLLITNIVLIIPTINVNGATWISFRPLYFPVLTWWIWQFNNNWYHSKCHFRSSIIVIVRLFWFKKKKPKWIPSNRINQQPISIPSAWRRHRTIQWNNVYYNNTGSHLIWIRLEWIFDQLFVILMFVAIHRNSNVCLTFRTSCLTVLTYFAYATLDRVCLVIIIYWSMLISFAHMLHGIRKKNIIQSDWHINIQVWAAGCISVCSSSTFVML